MRGSWPLVLSLLLWAPARAQVDQGVAMDTLVDRVALPFVHGGPWIGLSVGVIKDGRIYKYHYGTVEKGRDRKPDDETIYELGSITKTFTSLLYAHAVLEKKVKPDDDIRRYLTGNYPNLEFHGTPVQLLHLANSTSGLINNLPDVSPLFSSISEDSISFAMVKMNLGYGKDQFWADLHHVKLDTVPGLWWRHTNAGAQLLGYILENVYGQSYEDLVKKYITGPQQMNYTGVTLGGGTEAHLAKGYNGKGIPVPYIFAASQGAAGMKACLNDMVKYVSLQLNESDPAVRLTHTGGLDWFTGKSFNGQFRRFRMDGTTFGFTSYCLLYPELHFGLILMTNECAFNYSIQGQMEGMANAIFEECYYSPAKRSSDGFRFSRSINLLVAELDGKGYDHAYEAADELKRRDTSFTLEENEMNGWAYTLLRKGKKEKAVAIFALNARLYPQSPNVQESAGEGYEAIGDVANAIAYYRRALELDPNNKDAAERLKKLLPN